MQINRYTSSLEFDLPIGLEGRVLAALDHADAVTSHNPLLPILAQLGPACVQLSLPKLAHRHVWMKLSIGLQLRNGICDDIVDIL